MKNINRQDGGKVGRHFERKQAQRYGAPDPADDKGTGWQPTRAHSPLCAAEITQSDRVIVVPRGTDVAACYRWLQEFGIRVQSTVEVLEHVPEKDKRNYMVQAFVFKKRKHAALFKLAWG